MATSASQTYIAKLGFQDRDRSVDRHGLACEYLFERLLEMEVAPWLNQIEHGSLTHQVTSAESLLDQTRQRIAEARKHGDSAGGWYAQEATRLETQASEQYDRWQASLAKLEAFSPSYGINTARAELKAAYVINRPIRQRNFVIGFADVLMNIQGKRILGEVKITKQSAESILQQINFYELHIDSGLTYILTDFDCSDLQRMVEGTHIKVFRLGRRFEQWLAARTQFQSDEL